MWLCAERHGGAALERALCEQTAGERAVDVDVLLPGDARGGNLPAEERRGAAALEHGLHGVAVGARRRPDRLGNRGQAAAAGPVVPQQVEASTSCRSHIEASGFRLRASGGFGPGLQAHATHFGVHRSARRTSAAWHADAVVAPRRTRCRSDRRGECAYRDRGTSATSSSPEPSRCVAGDEVRAREDDRLADGAPEARLSGDRRAACRAVHASACRPNIENPCARSTSSTDAHQRGFTSSGHATRVSRDEVEAVDADEAVIPRSRHAPARAAVGRHRIAVARTDRRDSTDAAAVAEAGRAERGVAGELARDASSGTARPPLADEHDRAGDAVDEFLEIRSPRTPAARRARADAVAPAGSERLLEASDAGGGSVIALRARSMRGTRSPAAASPASSAAGRRTRRSTSGALPHSARPRAMPIDRSRIVLRTPEP